MLTDLQVIEQPGGLVFTGGSSNVDIAIALWLQAKRDKPAGKAGSTRTVDAYRAELLGFRAQLLAARQDLDSEPRLLADAAQIWIGRSGIQGRSKDTEKLRPPSSATMAQRKAILSSFYSFAVKRGRLAANPITLLDSIAVEEYHDVQPLDLDELNTSLALIERDSPKPMVRAAAVRDYALLSLALNSGHRLEALQLLDWGDVQVKGSGVYVSWRRMKGGKSRRGEKIGRATGEALMRWQGECLSVVGSISSDAPVWIQLAHNWMGGRLSKSAIADICRRRLGTSRFHRLRHTFAVVQEMAGTEVSRIAEALEHKSLDTTTRYLKRLRAQEVPNAEETEAIVGIR